MKLKMIVFGMAKDIVGDNVVEILIDDDRPTVIALKDKIAKQYPKLPDCMVAVNAQYALGDQVLNTQDEIALIPPTNGG